MFHFTVVSTCLSVGFLPSWLHSESPGVEEYNESLPSFLPLVLSPRFDSKKSMFGHDTGCFLKSSPNDFDS